MKNPKNNSKNKCIHRGLIEDSATGEPGTDHVAYDCQSPKSSPSDETKESKVAKSIVEVHYGLE